MGKTRSIGRVSENDSMMGDLLDLLARVSTQPRNTPLAGNPDYDFYCVGCGEGLCGSDSVCVDVECEIGGLFGPSVGPPTAWKTKTEQDLMLKTVKINLTKVEWCLLLLFSRRSGVSRANSVERAVRQMMKSFGSKSEVRNGLENRNAP